MRTCSSLLLPTIFQITQVDFWLGDAGFGLSLSCMVPYRGVRYHLKEWAAAAQRPQNKEELFNLRHSSLRNCVERILGVSKKRFPLLVTFNLHGYDFAMQKKFVRCAAVLYNIIRSFNLDDDVFDAWDWRTDQQMGVESAATREREHAVFGCLAAS